MKHREENAQTIRQDQEQFNKNVNEDSKRNQELSGESKRLAEDLERERQERAHKEKVERVATNLGMSGASEDDVKKELARRMERDEEFRQKMHDYAKRRDMAVDTLEKTVEIADYAMSAGESLGGAAGKAVSATYKGVKNTVSTVAEKGLSTGSVIEGVIKGGTEAATTVMNSGIGKAGVTIGGTVAGEVAGAFNDGADIGDAIKDGIIKGSGNAAIGAVGDAIGEVAEGEGLLNKAAETAEKLAETAYGKEIADPMYDKLDNKDD
jgi:predicted RNase H-like nuclease (RuvC/YqgF family)